MSPRRRTVPPVTVTKEMLRQAYIRSHWTLDDADAAAKAVAMAAAHLPSATAKMRERKRKRGNGTVYRVLLDITNQFEYLVLEEIERAELRQERGGHRLTQTDLTKRFIKPPIKFSMNHNAFYAAGSVCLGFGDYTSGELRMLYQHAALDLKSVKSDRDCGRVKKALFRRLYERFGHVAALEPSCDSKKTPKVRREAPTADLLACMRHGLALHAPSIRSPIVLPTSKRDNPSVADDQDEAEMQRIGLFLDPAAFDRLATLLGLDCFEHRARTIILRNDPLSPNPDPDRDDDVPMSRILALIDDETDRRLSARPGSLRVRVDGIDRARLDGVGQSAPMLLEEHASLVEIVADAADSGEAIVGTYILTYDGEKNEQWEVELPWSDRDRLTCSFDYGDDDCVGAMFARYQRPASVQSASGRTNFETNVLVARHSSLASADERESLEWLATLQDAGAPAEQRQEALERMLACREGWWGRGSLMQFAAAYALYWTRRKLPAGTSSDQIDWEGIADESLIVLFQSAPRIRGTPQGWFRGVLRNLVAREIEAQFPDLTVAELDNRAHEQALLQPGDIVGDYVILDHLGRGSFGETYKAQPARPSNAEPRLVVLKVCDGPSLGCSTALELSKCLSKWFRRPVGAPLIVGPLDVWTDTKYSVFLRQFVDGPTLHERLFEKPLTSTGAFEHVAAIFNVDGDLHRHDLVHADLKPSNIVLGTQGLRVLDFGIARSLERPRLVHRNVPYMAPECLFDWRVDARSDVYATGVIAYEMLTGTVPCDVDAVCYMAACRAAEPVPPAEVNPSVPSDLSDVIMRALSQDPARRYPDGHTFRNAWLECRESLHRATADATRRDRILIKGFGANAESAALQELYDRHQLSTRAQVHRWGVPSSQSVSHINRIFAGLMFDRGDDDTMAVTERLFWYARRVSCLASPDLFAETVDRLVVLEWKAALDVLAAADNRGLAGRDPFEPPSLRFAATLLLVVPLLDSLAVLWMWVEQILVQRHRRAIDVFEGYRSEIAWLNEHCRDDMLLEVATQHCFAPQDWRAVIPLARQLAVRYQREGASDAWLRDLTAAAERLLPRLKLRPSVGAALKALLEK